MTALALAALLALGAAPPIPELSGPVVDPAGLLSRAERRRLEALSEAAWAGRGGQAVQLQFLLVRTLDGDAIEDFSMRVAERWGIGAKGTDRGVLVVVAQEERKVRIEVGGGLEGQLTDAQSARIIRGAMVPAFRDQRYGDGLYDAALQILSATGALPPDAARRQSARPTHQARYGGLAMIVVVILFVVLRGLFFGF
jgi:uncharacterized protein